MKSTNNFLFTLFLLITVSSANIFPSVSIPADDPNIQYFGRWDFSDPKAPTHSWPGVYVYAVFEGTSIGIVTNDNFSYYNVFIDDTLFTKFHGNKSGTATYTLASGLLDGQHTILFTLRSETNWTKFTFNGFVLDDGKTLLPPPAKPSRKIEFIGDSYTVASGNEWTQEGAAPSDSLTNNYLGFGSIAARHYNAQYSILGRGGFGLVVDYLGNYNNNLPNMFDRTLVYNATPKWDFSQWTPNVVVICLGLNDYNGWGGYSGPIPQYDADLYKTRYHQFISTIMDEYPGVKILCVAPNGLDWLKTQVSQVVSEENAKGNNNVYYTYFPYYNGEYVNNGHPNLAAHQQIADQIISVLDTINAWVPYKDTAPPVFTSLPASPVIVSSASYALTVETDSYATVKYSTQDKSYNQMENEFTTTGNLVHSVTLNLQQGKQYTYYLRAMDVNGNVMDSSAVITLNVDTTKQLLTWSSPGYDLTGWQTGNAPLGNDNAGTNATNIAAGSTVYFRQSISMQNVKNITDLRVLINGHDGAVLYLNGTEINRINMVPGADITFDAYALSDSAINKSILFPVHNGLDLLIEGENVFGIEMHSRFTTNPDISFNAKIYDAYGKTYYASGSSWYYYNKGTAPANQVGDKVTGVLAGNNNAVPASIQLYANYPNPFNPSTNISFNLNKKSRVELNVYNILGQLITTLVNDELNAGKYNYQFDAKNLASGIYIYRLKTDSFTGVKKMMLLK